MNCPNCNQPLPSENTAFCPNCGAAATGAPRVTPVPPQMTAQPAGAPVQSVPSHLALGIISTLCCCLPLGIVSIVYAAQVSSLVASGNIAAAQESSRKAKFWGILAVVLGAISTVIAVILQAALTMIAAAGASAAN